MVPAVTLFSMSVTVAETTQPDTIVSSAVIVSPSFSVDLLVVAEAPF